MGLFDAAPSTCLLDDLLDFNIADDKALVRPLPDCEEEEELEWLSNKDVFPSVDTFVPSVEPLADMIPVQSSTTLKHESPVSVLENSNSSYGSNNNSNSGNAVITSCCSGRGLAPPIRRPRSRGGLRRKRGGFVDIPSQQWFIWCSDVQASKNAAKGSGKSDVTGRTCTHCGADKTPQWRAGPNGPKTLCNACGVRYKSGRLCPEYRPASSPTFSSVMHSNSHRKIVEMRKTKQMSTMTSNMTINPVDNG